MPEPLFNTSWLCFKKRHCHRCFCCEFCEISKNTLLTEHLRTTAYRLSAVNLQTFQFPIWFTFLFCYGHCVKRVFIPIRSFRIRLNTEESECGKIRIRKSSNTDTFHVVGMSITTIMGAREGIFDIKYWWNCLLYYCY